MNLYENLSFLWKLLDYSIKIKFWILVFLIILSGLFEIVSIGSFYPLMLSIINPKSKFLIDVNNLFNFNENLISLVICLFFTFVIIFSGIIRTYFLYLLNKFLSSSSLLLGSILYRNLCNSSYGEVKSKNISFYIDLLTNKIDSTIFNILYPLLNIISSTLILVFIITFSIYLGGFYALSLVFVIAILYLIFVYKVKKVLFSNSVVIAIESEHLIKIIRDFLGNLRDAKLGFFLKYFESTYERSALLLRSAQAHNTYISALPKYILENLGLVVLVWLTYMLSKNGDPANVVAILGMIALASQRALPMLQQIYSSYSNMRSGYYSLSSIVNYLQSHTHEKMGNKKVSFKRNIRFENVTYTYQTKKAPCINNVNFTIERGTVVGVIGPSGVGKSTLIELISGLLTPTSGFIYIDNEILDNSNIIDWRYKISYVSQDIFISNFSILQNITEESIESEVDLESLNKILTICSLNSLIDSIKGGIDATIDDNGSSFSGGQKQRILIARALYRKSELIILDEATSGLDDKTEKEFLMGLFSLQDRPTIIIVTHKVQLLEYCDSIIKLEHQKSS